MKSNYRVIKSKDSAPRKNKVDTNEAPVLHLIIAPLF